MRSDNPQLPCVQPPTSSNSLQLPHGHYGHGGHGGRVEHSGRGKHGGRLGQDGTGQDRTGQDRTGQDTHEFAMKLL